MSAKLKVVQPETEEVPVTEEKPVLKTEQVFNPDIPLDKLDAMSMEQITGRKDFIPKERVIFNFNDAKASNDRPKTLLQRMLDIRSKKA